MKNKIIVFVCSIVLAISVLSFTNVKQEAGSNVLVLGPNVGRPELYVSGPEPNVLSNKRSDQKALFDHDQGIYNNKANTHIRAVALVDKEKKTDEQDKQKVEDTQDKTKGQFLWKF